MTTFLGSPRLLKGEIVPIDAQTSVVTEIIPRLYNPDAFPHILKGGQVCR